jgi:hypothetical protein
MHAPRRPMLSPGVSRNAVLSTDTFGNGDALDLAAVSQGTYDGLQYSRQSRTLSFAGTASVQ